MPTITKRKIMKIGKRALMVIIPKAWSDYYGILPCDVVVVVADRNLTIYLPDDVHKDEREPN